MRVQGVLQLGLDSCGGKQVVAAFDGGEITSDAGLLLVRQQDKRLGLTRRLAECLDDPRDSRKVRHSRLDQLRQRVYGVAAGYEDCNDFDTLRHDPAFKLSVDRLPSDAPLCSQPTLSRLENSVTRRELWRMADALVDHFEWVYRKTRPKEIVLDFDASDDPAHGQQEFQGFHAYYDCHCYLPLFVTGCVDGRPHDLLAAVLRPGRVHAGHGAKAVGKRLVERLRGAFPKTNLFFRGDSGMAKPEIYDWCEESDVPYAISLAKNQRLLSLAEPLMEEARAQAQETGETVQLFGEFLYQAQSWPHPRRVVVKAEVMPAHSRSDNQRFVVTSRTDIGPEELYRWYCARGDMENRIGELKNDLESGRTSCHRFLANQFRLLLHAAAFVLMREIRRQLEDTDLATARVQTLRLRLIKVGARVVESVRRVVFHLPTAYPWPYLWEHLLLRFEAQ